MNDSLFSSNTVEWETPQDFFDKLNEEFHFTLDPCSTDENAKCEKHFTKQNDGLSQDWGSETVFCNPPYGRGMEKWIQKCAIHSISGGGYSGDADSGEDGYKSISSVHIREIRNPFSSWSAEIRKREKQRSFPVDGCCIQKA